ncbi:MAG: hypothetical protein NWS01_12230 [Burkholderiales bacterium]|nr:hypothetical protein [Burkholderiales bacterium]
MIETFAGTHGSPELANAADKADGIQNNITWNAGNHLDSFGGTHDMIGGKLSGLYDEQGNIKRGMSRSEKALNNRWSEAAIPIATPFAAAQGLSPEVWNAIGILLKATK